MAVENTHRVAKSQWRKWGEHARRVFNGVYEQMRADVSLYMHPDADVPLPSHWNTTSWNAAWIAADAVDEERRSLEREERLAS